MLSTRLEEDHLDNMLIHIERLYHFEGGLIDLDRVYSEHWINAKDRREKL